jgi:sialate O-acetylesterase
MPLSLRSLVSAAAVGCLVSSASASVAMPDLFGDHAVLQRSKSVPVWGHAEPGENVRVSVAGKSASAQAGSNGRWQVILDLSDAGKGPFQLVAEGPSNRVEAKDVLIGEVWVCSGQSNMDWSVSRTVHAADTIAQSHNEQLRVFEPKHILSDQPLDEVHGAWLISAPDVAGRFPAVGYFFGKDVQQALKVPVGLLSTSWGGTPSEAWTSQEALDSDPDLKTGSRKVIADVDAWPQRVTDYASRLTAWEKQNGVEPPAAPDPAQYADPKVSTADWTPVNLPGKLPAATVIWVRRTITVTPEMTVGPLFIQPGIISDFDTVYFNGVKVGETLPGMSGGAVARTYYLEKSTAGEATVAIRIVSPKGEPAMIGEGISVDRAALAGEWRAKIEVPASTLSAEAKSAYPAPLDLIPYPFRTPTRVYNSMLHSFIPYGIAGAVWYQGEDNADRAYQYRKAFPLMIQDWRRRWGRGDFPFYWCQLAGYGPYSATPDESPWAELREAQTKTLALPNTGQALLIDLGEEGDIHPRNKVPVGDRLARIALQHTYNRPVKASGPTYAGFQIEGSAIRVRFDHTIGGLKARPIPATYHVATVDATLVPRLRHSPDSQVEGFAICGEDRKWVWAQATIDGSTVVVRSPQVPHPVAVRYAWAQSPVCNLYNSGADLPAGPFRTDDFPGITREGKLGDKL